MPSISVCLTHFNRREKLAATLESLARQTVLPDELLVWDDCSANDPREVVEAFARRFPKLTYHRNEQNLGMPGNLNAVVARATGDYIANLHDADTFDPTLLEKWSAALTAHPTAGFVFCRVAGRNESQNSRLRRCPPLTPGVEFNRRYFLNSWRGSSPVWGTVMARRPVYEQYLPFDPALGAVADVDMWMRLSLAADVAFVDEGLIEADPDSHFVNAVNWSVIHALRRLHARNVDRYVARTRVSRGSLRGQHVAIFAFLYALCVASLLRHRRWRDISGAWRMA